jgi:aminoacrylate hydrolase
MNAPPPAAEPPLYLQKFTHPRPGVSIGYALAGAGPAVLLIQGVGVAGLGWRPQVEGLADAFRMITVDNRGVDGCRLPPGRLTIEDMAADALAVMDHLREREGIDRFHVVGHSMGGVIAQALALGARERIRSLAFLCTFATGRQATTLTAGMLVTGLRTRIGTRRMRRNAFLEVVMPAALLAGADRARLAEEMRPLFGRDLADSPAIIMKQLGAMGRYDASARLGELAAIPTLVVSGSEDRIARPAYGRALAAAIPGSRYVELPGAAHGVPIHSPATINDLLREHLGRSR